MNFDVVFLIVNYLFFIYQAHSFTFRYLSSVMMVEMDVRGVVEG